MLRVLVFLSILFVGTCITHAEVKDLPDLAADHLVHSLKKADSGVYFHFIRTTANVPIDHEKIERNARIVVHRKCSSRCNYFMHDVIEQLRGARHILECPNDNGLLLIKWSETEYIMYSYTYQLIHYNGGCYLSQVSLRDTWRHGFFE